MQICVVVIIFWTPNGFAWSIFIASPWNGNGNLVSFPSATGVTINDRVIMDNISWYLVTPFGAMYLGKHLIDDKPLPEPMPTNWQWDPTEQYSLTFDSFSFTKMHFKMHPTWWSHCWGLNVLIHLINDKLRSNNALWPKLWGGGY